MHGKAPPTVPPMADVTLAHVLLFEILFTKVADTFHCIDLLPLWVHYQYRREANRERSKVNATNLDPIPL